MIHTPKFPLQLGDRALFEETETAKKVVMFHLRNLILTSPGEKISDPLYGVGIKRYLFENITTGLLNNIAKDIDLSIRRYLSYIDVEDIIVSSPTDTNILRVKIAFSIPNLDIIDELVLDVSNI